MDKSDFGKLERLNAQMDIWIDEEEYNKVEKACEIEPTWKQSLSEAFEHPTCTRGNGKDQKWLDVLKANGIPPIKSVQVDSSHITPIEDWSFFFWAKLIRAKIQQTGTDCYYRRLDDVIAYLERHLPIIVRDDPQSAILAAIYFLEMSAAGVGADQRSFADRARRVLMNNLRESRYKQFVHFYDLLARYNIGVGYFHESSYRKSVLEFNYIISELQHEMQSSKSDHAKFFKNRLVEALLYSPSVLYRADIQLKLQLAYHARDTLRDDLLKFLGDPSPYEMAKTCLVRAQAYQLIGDRVKAWNELNEASKYKQLKISLDTQDQVTVVSARPLEKYANIKSRIQNHLAYHYFQYLKERKKSPISEDKFRLYLNRLSDFLKECKESTKHQQSNRIGYLEQIAEYLAWLTDRAGEKADEENETARQKKSILQKEAEKIYKTNRGDLLHREARNIECACPCEEKGIDLQRLGSEHYDAFYENMRNFFRDMSELLRDNQKRDLVEDKNKFMERLKDLEKRALYNLEWRKRNLDLEIKGSPPKEWCDDYCMHKMPKRCLFSDSFKGGAAFSGLLTCLDSKAKKINNYLLDKVHLLDKDYEQIMDNWDELFLRHLDSPSVHEPHRRAIYFLGLQRWNSTSPAQGRSLGGGYVVYHTDERGCIDLGVAVDPGFDFLRNLFHVGLSLADIDVVLLSHAHVDHVRDFESILSLLYELRKRKKEQLKLHKLHTIMTLGVYRRLEFLIKSPGLREFVEPYIVDIEKEINDNYPNQLPSFTFMQDSLSIRNLEDPKKLKDDKNQNESRLRFMPVIRGEGAQNTGLRLIITPKLVYHNDHSEYSDSFGFLIRIEDSKGEVPLSSTIGYTSDTSWQQKIMKKYFKECNTLLVHLGSLIDRNKPKRKKFQYYKNKQKCFELVREKNHPYMMGMLHFLTEIDGWKCNDKKRLILMSEFGEEMRGKIRIDLVERLKQAYKHINVLPVDVGIDVLLSAVDEDAPRVRCVQCEHFVPLGNADFRTYGHDEALFCVCGTCRKSTPLNVLQERLHELYEVGRSLQTV
ncbi:MAG: MBL fold metallo-hydrolase [Candidatus Hodarchaeota archaeon]